MKDLFNPEPIYCLWWKQPYAELMFHGKIETRTWDLKADKLPRKVLICASQKPFNVEQVMDISGRYQYLRLLVATLNSEPDNGCAVGIADLIQVRPMYKADEDKTFVKWSPDVQRYCHVYENVQRIEPFPLKGKQGWLKATPEIISQIKIIE